MRNRKFGSVSANKKSNRGKALLKTIGSVLFAIIATSHHWLHILLISVGLTSIGAVLFNMPPLLKIILLAISLVISIRFTFVAKRKWTHERPVAWVYAISSILSIVIVFSAVPQTISAIIQPFSNTQNPNIINTHNHNHSDMNK